MALALALNFNPTGEFKSSPLIRQISAISVGFHKDQALLDLNYDEDSNIETDMNFVMTDSGDFVEIQGTAEAGSI